MTLFIFHIDTRSNIKENVKKKSELISKENEERKIVCFPCTASSLNVCKVKKKSFNSKKIEFSAVRKFTHRFEYKLLKYTDISTHM